ncbi:MAG TPA: EboA domain-containing protein [Cyclobacteriaceae bacterium]|jgi:muconolactone delta-isomerase|nr:EboA domain-containing protein [Cyclobacteriaceae bacterium]
MFAYDVEKLKAELSVIIKESVPDESWNWLKEKGEAIGKGNIQQFNTAFVAAPRKTGKNPIKLSSDQEGKIKTIRKNLIVKNWTIDRLSRVWLLLQLDPAGKEGYITAIESLFRSAEMNELAALYSSLPVLAYPDAWQHRCTEGIRNNIGIVLESVMCENPYPSENLDEGAWNQLVLKALFTEKPIHKVIGIEERANQHLANTISDYAHERWAAHRTILPQLWRSVGKFINESIFPDIERIAYSENSIEREAAMLACSQSNFKPAQELLNKNPEIKSLIQRGEITWNKLAEKS